MKKAKELWPLIERTIRAQIEGDREIPQLKSQLWQALSELGKVEPEEAKKAKQQYDVMLAKANLARKTLRTIAPLLGSRKDLKRSRRRPT